MLIHLISQQSDRKAIEPIQTFVSAESAITLGAPISFTHNWVNFDPLTQAVLLTGFLVCTSDNLGYFVGDIVTPDRGMSYQVTLTRFTCWPDDKGVFVIRANNGKSGKINAGNWNFLLKALVL